MNCYLSKNEIKSFAGDVVCLKLMSDVNLEKAPICWKSNSEKIRIRLFDGDFSVNDGILITLLEPGDATVTATYEGVSYECKIEIKQRRTAEKDEPLNFYIGDFHVHSTMNHRNQSFNFREDTFPADTVRMTRDEGKLDFTVITDHGSVISDKDFFRSFIDAQLEESDNLIVFPGSESEISYMEMDIYGLPSVPCGEFVVVNSSRYVYTDSFERAEKLLSEEPLPICSIAHPQEFSSMKGFCISGLDLCEERSEGWKRLIKLIELGNGSDRGFNLLFEYSYSLALDNGYRLAPVSTSDSHGPVWGFDAFPGKTVILAPEKTKDLLIDAIYRHRVYATENGRTKLTMTVNGRNMGEELPLTDEYTFHVEIGSLDENPPPETVRCEVISDYGEKIKILEGMDSSSFDFTVRSNTARYFYLRITHSDETKTWSAPVWTGRMLDSHISEKMLTRLDKSSVKIQSATAEGAEKLLNFDPRDPWDTRATSAEVTFDFGKETELCALSLWVPYLDLREVREKKLSNTKLSAQFPARYRISLSSDGKSFSPACEGYLRKMFSGYLAHFEKRSARFVKLELTESMGHAYGRSEYKDAEIKLGEVEFYF